MKILILHDYLTSYGGAERILEELLVLFPEAVIYTSKYIPEIFPRDSIIRSRVIHEFFIFRYLSNSTKYRTILRSFSYFAFLFLDTSEYDLVVSNTSGPANWVLKSCQIAYFHKIPSFDFFISWNPINLIFSKINHCFVKRLKLVITNSNFNKSNFEKIYNFPVEKLKVVYPFLSTTSLSIIEKYSTNSKKDYYVYIGRLEGYKMIKEITEICIETKTKLKVIGEGSLSNKLPISEYIEYFGFVDEQTKFQILSEAKGLIALGGLREEFGIVYLESILCKTPFIAMNSGGAVELSNPENSILINDISELKTAIVQIENKKISEYDVAVYKQKFSKESFDSDIREYTK